MKRTLQPSQKRRVRQFGFFGPHGHEERSCHHQSPPQGWPQAPRRCRNRPQVCQAHPRVSEVAVALRATDFNPRGSSFPRRTECDGYPFSAHAAPASESLPRSRIIRRRGVFDTARNKGRRVSSRHFVLNFIAREAFTSGETGSVAFLTPKRLGPATVRNKLRRRMRRDLPPRTRPARGKRVPDLDRASARGRAELRGP